MSSRISTSIPTKRFRNGYRYRRMRQTDKIPLWCLVFSFCFPAATEASQFYPRIFERISLRGRRRDNWEVYCARIFICVDWGQYRRFERSVDMRRISLMESWTLISSSFLVGDADLSFLRRRSNLSFFQRNLILTRS